MIIYLKDNKLAMTVDNKMSIDVNTPFPTDGMDYYIINDSDLPKPIGYYDLNANDNAIIFIDKETKAEIKPKIIEHKIR